MATRDRDGEPQRRGVERERGSLVGSEKPLQHQPLSGSYEPPDLNPDSRAKNLLDEPHFHAVKEELNEKRLLVQIDA